MGKFPFRFIVPSIILFAGCITITRQEAEQMAKEWATQVGHTDAKILCSGTPDNIQQSSYCAVTTTHTSNPILLECNKEMGCALRP